MERTRLRKTAALACSLALAGAYLGYRLVGAGDAGPPAAAPTAERAPGAPLRPDAPASDPTTLIGTEDPAQPRTEVPFWSSKSMPMFGPGETQTSPSGPGK